MAAKALTSEKATCVDEPRSFSMLASASGSSYGQRLGRDRRPSRASRKRPTPAAAGRSRPGKDRSPARPASRARTVGRRCPCTSRRRRPKSPRTTQADTLTMLCDGSRPGASVTSKQTRSMSRRAPPRRGRGQRRWAFGSGLRQRSQRPRRWAGTPRLMTVSRANFGSTSAWSIVEWRPRLSLRLDAHSTMSCATVAMFRSSRRSRVT